MSKHKNLGSIEKLMDGFNPYRQRQEETRGLVKKWEPTGLLEGIDEEQRVQGMACLLENQARQLIDEASSTGTSSNSEEWSGVALPLVRKIFGELAAQEFVSVQPMNLPSGLIFYLDFKYGTAQPGVGSGDQVFGVTSASGDPSQGLYGAGRFGYSINESTSTQTASSVAGTSGSATWAMVDFEPGLSSSLSSLTHHDIPLSTMSNPDKEGARAWQITGSVALTATYPAYTKIVDGLLGNEVSPGDNSASHVRFIVDESAATPFMSVLYHKQPADTSRGDFEVSHTVGADPEEANVGIPEIDIAMRSIPIVAKTRKLKAVWTPELAQDLNAYHSVDAEAELTSMLSDYISMEIDLEILDMLISDAQTQDYWSAKSGEDYDSANTEFVTTTFYGTRFEWYQTLVAKIQKMSNEIHRLTLRGGANFVVCSPKVATILESLPGYNSSPGDADAAAAQFSMGVSKIGQVAGRYTVYKNPYMVENNILVGFRGSNFLETGAVYSPYVPLITTPLVYDPSDFTPRKGVMTRYAKKMIRPEFYGVISVKSLDLI